MKSALPLLQADARIVGVAGTGSMVSGQMDAYSDLDLLIVSEDRHADSLFAERSAIAGSLGRLLSGFTGEHVGVPRILICLYDSPLLHVDLHFVSLADLAGLSAERVVLWQRGTALDEGMRVPSQTQRAPDLQWIEDRFWVWVHYAAAKIGRGELFETLDFLSFLRAKVLGPLALSLEGVPPRGVRRLEISAPRFVASMRATIAAHDRESCLRAVRAAVELYRRLREESRAPSLVPREDAERAAWRYLEEVAR